MELAIMGVGLLIGLRGCLKGKKYDTESDK
jgi:hypothetical protein